MCHIQGQTTHGIQDNNKVQQKSPDNQCINVLCVRAGFGKISEVWESPLQKVQVKDNILAKIKKNLNESLHQPFQI